MNNQIIGTLYIRIVNESGKDLFNIKHNITTTHLKTQIDLSGQGDGIYFIEPVYRRHDLGLREIGW